MRRQIVKTTAFFDVLGIPVGKDQLFAYLLWEAKHQPDEHIFEQAVQTLLDEQKICSAGSLFCLPERLGNFSADYQQAQERSRALLKSAKAWSKALALFPGVEAIAVCNTVAFGHAGEDSDIDFFILTKPGWLWQTRFFLTAFLHLLGKRPKPGNEYGTICLSFFLQADRLDLRSVALKEDIYLDYWIRTLTPLYDPCCLVDRLKEENRGLCRAHVLPEKQAVPASRWHGAIKALGHWLLKPFHRLMEQKTKSWQQKRFPETIQTALQKGGTEVVVNDIMLKFHTNDRRLMYKHAYEERHRQALGE